MEQNNIFLYHLDNELQKLFSLKSYNKDVLYEAFLLVTKIAFLVCKDTSKGFGERSCPKYKSAAASMVV